MNSRSRRSVSNIHELAPEASGSRVSRGPDTAKATICIGALIALLSSCGESRSQTARGPSENARVLRNAARATLNSDGFRAVRQTADSSVSDGTRTIFEYVFPDRLHSVAHSRDSTEESFVIGTDYYLPLLDQPGKFFRQTAPLEATIGPFLAPLRVVAEVEASRVEGKLFLFSFPASNGMPPGSGEAELSDGRIARLALFHEGEAAALSAEYVYSEFGEVGPIRRPPPEAVVPFEMGTLPPCSPQGESSDESCNGEGAS